MSDQIPITLTETPIDSAMPPESHPSSGVDADPLITTAAGGRGRFDRLLYGSRRPKKSKAKKRTGARLKAQNPLSGDDEEEELPPSFKNWQEFDYVLLSDTELQKWINGAAIPEGMIAEDPIIKPDGTILLPSVKNLGAWVSFSLNTQGAIAAGDYWKDGHYKVSSPQCQALLWRRHLATSRPNQLKLVERLCEDDDVTDGPHPTLWTPTGLDYDARDLAKENGKERGDRKGQPGMGTKRKRREGQEGLVPRSKAVETTEPDV